MAPEQAEGREAGAAADLYSTALVIYEGLTGVNPILTGTVAVRTRRLGAYLPPLRRQRRDLPRELGQGIDLALRPRARERGTVAELRHALTVSLELVEQEPGVVSGPWPTRGQADEPEHAGAEHPAPAPPLRWLEVAGAGWATRALGAAAAAGLTAWVAGHVLAPAPVAPAAAALIAAVATAVAPRLGWLGLLLTATAVAASQGRPGLAVALAVTGLAPVVLMPRSGARWPLPAACPALGAIALAGAWPALAGRAATAWSRAALGAIGWLWLIVAMAMTGRELYGRRLPGLGLSADWMSSPGAALDHLLGPLATTGVLAPAAVWALAATVLPWLAGRRRVPALTVVIVFGWAAGTAAGTAIVLNLAARGHGVILPGEGILGAVACGFGALVPNVRGQRRLREHRPDADRELA
jgi:serine/threonine-protein kinase